MRSVMSTVTALAIVALAAPASARTWRVPSECPTIQAGVDSAAAGDTVAVACGTYYEHDIAMKSGVCLTSEAGEPECVTIDAQQEGRVIYCLGVDGTSHIAGFTITGGLAYGAAQMDSCGGGIYCEDSSPTIVRCLLSDNFSALAGGGLFCSASAGSAPERGRLLGGSRFTAGGGPTVSDCVFSGNGSQAGGGVFSYCGSPTLADCSFSGNGADRGGGLCCAADAAALAACTFSGNRADNGGGAAYFTSGSLATVTDCVMAFNTAVEDGGAVCCDGLSCPAFTGVRFAANTAVWSGGGVWCAGGAPSFDHVEFAGNKAGLAGGGLGCRESAPLTIVNATFCNNEAADGGGDLDCDGTWVTLTNSIVAFSSSPNGIACRNSGGATLSCCDVYGNAGGDWVDCIAGQDDIDNNFSADPLFCCSMIGDFTLREDSPCLPGKHPEGATVGLIGAWDVGCPATPPASGITENVFETTWGAIKARFW